MEVYGLYGLYGGFLQEHSYLCCPQICQTVYHILSYLTVLSSVSHSFFKKTAEIKGHIRVLKYRKGMKCVKKKGEQD